MKTRVIVADNARARIFSSDSTLLRLEEIEDFAHPEARLADRDLASDAAGRSSDRGDAYNPATSPSEHEVDSFAQLLAQRLKQLHNEEHFDSLMLVAPPKFLGLLRSHLDGPLDALVSRTVDKDLSTRPVDEIIDQLRE
jgi:protein required for attachment to host cells